MRKLLLFIALFWSSIAFSQTRIIVPFPVGGGTDLVARIIFSDITNRTGQQFIIENVPGAGGDIGRQRAIRDNVLLFTPNSLLISAHLEKIKYDPFEEFKAVVGIGVYPYLVSAHPSFNIKSLNDLRALSKVHGTINIGSAGTSGANHLIISQLSRAIGFKVEPIPHRGTPDAIMSTISGSVPLMVSGIQGTNEFIKSGKLKPIAVTTNVRDINLKNVPTVQEMTKKSFDYPGWFGLVAPKRYDDTLLANISREVIITLNSRHIIEKLNEQSIAIWAYPPQKFMQFLIDDNKNWFNAVNK